MRIFSKNVLHLQASPTGFLYVEEQPDHFHSRPEGVGSAQDPMLPQGLQGSCTGMALRGRLLPGRGTLHLAHAHTCLAHGHTHAYTRAHACTGMTLRGRLLRSHCPQDTACSSLHMHAHTCTPTCTRAHAHAHTCTRAHTCTHVSLLLGTPREPERSCASSRAGMVVIVSWWTDGPALETPPVTPYSLRG